MHPLPYVDCFASSVEACDRLFSDAIVQGLSGEDGRAIFCFKMQAEPTGLTNNKELASLQNMHHLPIHEQIEIWRIEMPKTNEEKIRDAAYQIWENEGCPSDRNEVHWEKAKLELAASQKNIKPNLVKQLNT